VTPAEAIRDARALLAPCRLCPRRCGVDRTRGGRGLCGAGALPVVASAGPHFGEEPPLVGHGGSGTLFLSGCNLRCVFCQNADISHGTAGTPCDAAAIAGVMAALAQRGCHNINFVTPTHVTPVLMEAVALARRDGLSVPIVYNCGGYESLEALRLLEGFVDIYMPDVKFASAEAAERYCRAPDYPEVMRAALAEMHRQVGDLAVEDGLAVRGLLVRHLVMPGDVCGSRALLDFLADTVSPRTCVNVMAQYRPCFHAPDFPEIDRRPTPDEVESIRAYARQKGLRPAE
jgi:putative pyruvate formate lyase activating enzyme